MSYLTEPIGGEITVACESSLVGSIPKTTMEKALAEQLKDSKLHREVESSERNGCYYTPIPRVIKQKGISGAELTSVNLDKVTRVLPVCACAKQSLLTFAINSVFLALMLLSPIHSDLYSGKHSYERV